MDGIFRTARAIGKGPRPKQCIVTLLLDARAREARLEDGASLEGNAQSRDPVSSIGD